MAATPVASADTFPVAAADTFPVAAAAASPVAAATAELLTPLADLPVAEHVAVFDAVHRLLQDALATLDQG